MEYLLLFFGALLLTFVVSAVAVGVYERDNRGLRPGSL